LRATGSETRALHATLDAVGHRQKGSRSKRLGASLALLLTLAAPGWLVLQKYPPAYLLADVRTAPGRPETRPLPDNTRLTLKGASAVNLSYDARQRTLDLVHGEVLLDVARDARRPFVVETRQGRIQALGTRFAVRCDGDGTEVSVLESKTAVRAATASGRSSAEIIVSAGQRVRIGADGLGAVEPIDVRSVADAWRYNQLLVQDARLPDVLDELARQRIGVIRYDRAVLANVRVSAVLPLDDTDQALRLLSSSHRLRLTYFTPWLVSVDAAAKPSPQRPE
jgi:transmembrane sensor